MCVNGALQVFCGHRCTITFVAIVMMALVSVFPTLARSDDENCRSVLTKAAVAAGVSKPHAVTMLAQQRSNPIVLRNDRHQPETVLPFDRYLERFLTGRRIHQGKERLAADVARFERLESDEKVEASLLVALWGIETDFGRVLGDFDVINSLFTLACDTRRSRFFTRELLVALELFERGAFGRERVDGSWAGAMGQLQFLPSVLQRYGADLDGNGRFDVFDASPELFVIGSRFLRGSGWQHGVPWGFELAADKLPDDVPVGELLKPEHWHSLALRRSDGSPVPLLALDVRIVVPGPISGRRFIVFPNFETILHWNRSTRFALTAGLLMNALSAP